MLPVLLLQHNRTKLSEEPLTLAEGRKSHSGNHCSDYCGFPTSDFMRQIAERGLLELLGPAN